MPSVLLEHPVALQHEDAGFVFARGVGADRQLQPMHQRGVWSEAENQDRRPSASPLSLAFRAMRACHRRAKRLGFAPRGNPVQAQRFQGCGALSIGTLVNTRDDKAPAGAHPPPPTQQVSAMLIHTEISLLERLNLVHPPAQIQSVSRADAAIYGLLRLMIRRALA